MIIKTNVLLILALIVVMAGSLFVSPAAASGVEVPFKSAIYTSPVILGMEDNCLVVQIPAEGYTTHLGETTWYADMLACFDGTQFGPMEFTAPNGDQLFGEFRGTWTGMPPNPVTFQGTFWITSGTGRFEGVNATGTYSGRSEGGEGILYFDGRLTK